MVTVDQNLYRSAQSLHKSFPAFTSYLPDAVLPYLAFVLLAATFTLAFYFSTLPKNTMPIREFGIASAASVLGGFGVVALFCSVGVYV